MKETMTNRRTFLAGAGALVGAGALPSVARADASAGLGATTVKFLAFADLHYDTTTAWPHTNREWLDQILKRAVDEKVDFVMSLGDFTFGPHNDKVKEFVRYYNEFKPVKTYHTYGNHEFESTTPDVLDAVYKLPSPHYSFDKNGFRFVVLDPHYYLEDKVYHRFSKRCSYPEKGVNSYILPPEQLKWLRETVVGSPYPCVVFSHESIERDRGHIHPRHEILKIFAEANRKKPGTVRLVITGHAHKDYLRMLDGVAYLELNSATYDIMKRHTAYPEKFRKECANATCILTWETPLSAVITLTSDGGMKIDGGESKWLYGVTPGQAGWGCDDSGRPTSNKIQSVDWKFNY